MLPWVMGLVSSKKHRKYSLPRWGALACTRLDAERKPLMHAHSDCAP